MMIWINGAFGAGKTTLAEELHRRLPDALAFDPEYVGYLLREWVPSRETGDFQDIPLWRKLVAEFAIGMSAEYGRPLIIPMTLINPAYRDQIFGLISKAGERILHVFLNVPPAELHRRIDAQVLVGDNSEADASARAFRHAPSSAASQPVASFQPVRSFSVGTSPHPPSSRTSSSMLFRSRPWPISAAGDSPQGGLHRTRREAGLISGSADWWPVSTLAVSACLPASV